MKSKIGTLCMILGAVLVMAALSLFVFNHREDERAGENAEKILPLVIERIKAEPSAPDDELPAVTETTSLNDTEMREAEIDGLYYIGYLSVPALGLELPVMSSWSYEQLKIAPCRYSGSAKTDDLVICAHNYERHFGSIGSLACGELVYFTDMDGQARSYTVETVETLAPGDIEDMTSGGYELTLFTCTYNGQSRVTVRCAEVKD